MHDLSHVTTALIVEDEYLIAIDIGAALTRGGCRNFEMAANVTDSLKRIALGGVEFATLDIELKDGSCALIAKILAEQRIPFVYVSGYLPSDYPEKMPSAPWVEKPASDEDLMGAALEACSQFSAA